jgi:DNA-binding LacI/PurR family transcriptional regulator
MTGMPYESGINWVDHDNFESVSKVFKYLYSLGHRRIAYMGFKNTVEYHAEMVFENYRGSMKELGVYKQNYYLAEKTTLDYRCEAGTLPYEKCAEDIIKKTFKMKELPTAAFVDSINLAYAIKTELGKRSIRIPGDFSIATGAPKHGRENDEFFSVLEVNEVKRARIALKTLISLLDGSLEGPLRIFIERKFKEGKSTQELKLLKNKK